MPYRFSFLPLALTLLAVSVASADPPHASYIFPAGGQRGTKVKVHVGGHNLHEGAAFRMYGDGVRASERVERTKTKWFEGPVIEQPASQRKEDYPKDYAGEVEIAEDAAIGLRHWRVASSQGVTARRKFIIGTLPEVVENEVDGTPIPTLVKIPVTINGRIFPREDVDVWTFSAKAGELVSCEVMAARLGSPLDSRLEIRDSRGRLLAQNVDAIGADSFLKFEAPADDVYECRIHDINFGGLQDFVYRLSIRRGPCLESVFPLGLARNSTALIRLVGSGLPEAPVELAIPDAKTDCYWWNWNSPGGSSSRTVRIALHDRGILSATESEPNDEIASLPGTPVSQVPARLNGRIDRSGDVDLWTMAFEPEKQIQIDVLSSRAGMQLDSVIRILDEAGKQLAANDDAKSGVTDSRLIWKVPSKKTWFLEVKDQLPSRGGDQFAYQISVTELPASDFTLTLPQDSLTVDRGGEAKLKLDVTRNGFKGEIEIDVEGLPEGVSVEGTNVGKNKPNTQLIFKATDMAAIRLSELKIVGKALETDAEIIRTAQLEVPFGEPSVDRLTLAVTVPTPFKFRAPFETKYAARGTTFTRHYFIDRNGYDGPIEVGMADRQARHLQGVAGKTIVVPAGESEFDYTVTLPSWMKIGRTSRTTLVASGFVEDDDGTKHRVCYSSQAQDDQIILLVDPVRLSLDTSRKAVGVQPGSTVSLPVNVRRGTGLKGQVVLRLKSAAHIRGWRSEPVRVSADSDQGTLVVELDSDPGPFNMPLAVLGEMTDERGEPVTFELPIQFRLLK